MQLRDASGNEREQRRRGDLWKIISGVRCNRGLNIRVIDNTRRDPKQFGNRPANGLVINTVLRPSSSHAIIMKKLFSIAGIGALSFFSFLAWRAHAGLVTLHVRNAPISQVVSQLRWQTWENFIVNTNVQGKLTLDVDRMPLDRVLEIIGEQVNARWATVYPIYRQKSSLVSLERALRGEAQLTNSAFSNVGAPGGPFRNGMPELRPVTIHFTNSDLLISALALERFGGGQVLVEKNATSKITLDLASKPFGKAVEKVASAAHRSTVKLYALQPMRSPGMMALGRGEGRPGRGGSGDPEAEAQRAERMQQVLQTLPEEERKQAELRMLDRAAMQSLTPEQRQQVMAERMNSPEMQARAEQRAISGIKNTTPEQRHDRYERMYEMRQARSAGLARKG